MASLLDYAVKITKTEELQESSPNYLQKLVAIAVKKTSTLESFTVAIDKTSIVAGETAQLSLTDVVEAGASVASVVYTSSDESIATVDGSGVVTTLTAGSVTFNATVGSVSGDSPELTVTQASTKAQKARLASVQEAQSQASQAKSVAKENPTTPYSVDIFSKEELVEHTNNTDLEGVFDGGLNLLTLIVVDDAESMASAAHLLPDGKEAYTLILTSDLTIQHWIDSAATWTGQLCFCISDYEAEKDHLSNLLWTGYYDTNLTGKNYGYGLCFTLGKFCSGANFEDLQYMQVDATKVGGVQDNGLAEQLFDDRATFFINDPTYGTRLSGLFSGGQAFSKSYIDSEINFYIQQETLGFTTNTRPRNTQATRLALENRLQENVVEVYIEKNYLKPQAMNLLSVKELNEQFYAEIDGQLFVTLPVWRFEATISSES